MATYIMFKPNLVSVPALLATQGHIANTKWLCLKKCHDCFSFTTPYLGKIEKDLYYYIATGNPEEQLFELPDYSNPSQLVSDTIHVDGAPTVFTAEQVDQRLDTTKIVEEQLATKQHCEQNLEVLFGKFEELKKKVMADPVKFEAPLNKCIGTAQSETLKSLPSPAYIWDNFHFSATLS